MRWIGAVLGFCLAIASGARAEELKVYVFGNSLIHHLSETDETTVPHWLSVLTRATGVDFALDGQWGFMRNFAEAERPQPNWSFDDVPRAWTRQYRNFEDVGWDVVMFNPGNWIQYKPADKPYDGENKDGSSPLSAALRMIDRVQANAAPGRFVLYEGWAKLDDIRRFPPTARELRRYHQFNAGKYHDWYRDYLNALRKARPDIQIDMIPVASVMAELFDGGVLSDLPAEALYLDDGPHGTPTTYFLAAAITYAGLYQTPLPETLDLPDSIHEDVRVYWDAVRDEIHRIMASNDHATAPGNGASSSDATTETNVAGLGVSDPALAMGLAAITDYSTQNPFIDRMKSARPWVGHLPGQWGGVSFEDLADMGLLDEEGWVWGIPDSIESIETLLMTNQPEDATGLAGRYRVTWKGSGDLRMTGRARVVSRDDGEIWFDYTPGDGPVGVQIFQTDPERTGDYIHDIVIVAEDQIPLWEAGALFNPDWLALVQDLRMVRFMGWMQTNGSTQETWADRPRSQDFSWSWRGAPVEVMVRLANEIGADPWFCMPHMADEDYIRRFAAIVHDTLDPDLRAYVEYSNELWNFGFTQSHWAGAEAQQRWGKNAAPDAWIQYAGLKAAETAQIWTDVYGEDAARRLVRVVATHTGWLGLEEGMLQAPLAQREGIPAPVESFDAYAITGYFGLELGSDEGAPEVLKWLEEAEAKAQKDGQSRGLKRAALDAFVAEHQLDGVSQKAAAALRDGSLKQVISKVLPYHAKVAQGHDLGLVMYEGGSHVTGIGPWADNEALTRFFIDFNSSPEMGGLYEDLLAAWKQVGGQAFNAFEDVGPHSKWGSWGHLRHLWDETPRNSAVSQYNAAGRHWDETRTEGAFLQGGIFTGTDQADRIKGTAKRDVLLGGGGNDILVAHGPGDLLHGGKGNDRAELPGSRQDYRFEEDGNHVRATSGTATYLLTGIEAVSFADTPALVMPLAGLL